MSSARSSAAASPPAAVSRPSALNGTGGAGDQQGEVRPTPGDPPGQRAVRRELAGERGTDARRLAPLAVERHVEPLAAIAAGAGQPRGEVPAEARCPQTRRVRGARHAERAGLRPGERRIDAGEGELADAEPPVVDPRGERLGPVRRARHDPVGQRPGQPAAPAGAAPARAARAGPTAAAPAPRAAAAPARAGSTPDPSVAPATSTPPATITGSGSSDRLIGPSIVTRRPSADEAIASTVLR